MNVITRILPRYEIIIPHIEDSRFGAKTEKVYPKIETNDEMNRERKFLFVLLPEVSKKTTSSAVERKTDTR